MGAEELGQPLGRHVVLDRKRILAPARRRNRVRAQIRREDLKRAGMRLQPLDDLAEDHGQRIGLLAGRAAYHPGAQPVVPLPPRQQFRQYGLRQILPGLGIAEETGHANQQFLEQQVALLRALFQELCVLRQGGHAMDGHAPFRPAMQRAGFVQRKVMAGLSLEQGDDPLQGGGGRLGWGLLHGFVRFRHRGHNGQDARRQLARRRDDIGATRLDRAFGHRIELRRFGALHRRQAAHGLDRLQTRRAVRAHAGEHHPDGALALPTGQR